MKLTKLTISLVIIAGIILYFVLPANQFFLYFGIPTILIVNGVRIFEQRKKCSSTWSLQSNNFTEGETSETLQKVASIC